MIVLSVVAMGCAPATDDTGASTASIVGGTPPASPILAVGDFASTNGQGTTTPCTAELIDSHVALLAAHCVALDGQNGSACTPFIFENGPGAAANYDTIFSFNGVVTHIRQRLVFMPGLEGTPDALFDAGSGNGLAGSYDATTNLRVDAGSVLFDAVGPGPLDNPRHPPVPRTIAIPLSELRGGTQAALFAPATP